MKVLVDRYDPDSGEKRTDEFEVAESACEGMTVMGLLSYLALHCDPTIAYYHHSVCDHGICGRCTLSVNGKARLACITPVAGLGKVHLAPAPGRAVVRDLVTR
ncbi:MAG: succinate dehydrogenase [Clostridiaceae bacterium]|nr:succinate dehydrogenase [Clostridiaceae bacterium]